MPLDKVLEEYKKCPNCGNDRMVFRFNSGWRQNVFMKFDRKWDRGLKLEHYQPTECSVCKKHFTYNTVSGKVTESSTNETI